MQYRINEIFYSIQGEGGNAGMPAIFIRLAGCDRKCSFCDTDHSEKKTMYIKQILEELKQYSCSSVILTGGEPTIQPIEELIAHLLAEKYFICVETNGYDMQRILNAHWITFSPKETNMNFKHTYWTELKIVYVNGVDLSPYWKYRVKGPYNFLQPLYTENGSSNTEEVIEYIKKNPEWRLSLQCQKLINIK